MNSINISFCILLSALFALSHQGLIQLKNTSGHEIIDGNCSTKNPNDRVYYDHVDKMAIPLIVRSEKVEYRGDREIYCIEALNQKNNETGGTSQIIDGGVGHQYVDIDLESFRGHGLEFYVSIFAKNDTRLNRAIEDMPQVILSNKNN